MVCGQLRFVKAALAWHVSLQSCYLDSPLCRLLECEGVQLVAYLQEDILRKDPESRHQLMGADFVDEWLRHHTQKCQIAAWLHVYEPQPVVGALLECAEKRAAACKL